MRKLAPPTDDAKAVFLGCISIVENTNLKSRLQSVAPLIEAAALQYGAAAAAHILHTLTAQASVGGVVTIREMSDIYTYRMVRKGSPGRPLYDKLMTLPAHGRCPLCAQRTVSTLDHYLAKTSHPALSVVPANLVPACADCNKAKLARVPLVPEDQTLHPYYDDVEAELWLHAEIVESAPAAVVFSVKEPVGWDAVKIARVNKHFSTFGLSALYASHAAEELVNIRYSLGKLYGKSGSDGVRSHLVEQNATYQAANVNSWQSAMYAALSESDWYCDGGFDT